MSRDMADYYELLGVDVDAPVDDIRVAYRDKKAAVADTGTDAAKADAAALNKAWNVLSDPYQRGRYDQQRASSDGFDDTDDDDDDDESDAKPARRSPKADAKSKSKSNTRRPPLEPTIKLPAGLRFPAPKQRFFALAIDVVILIVLFLGSQFLTVSLEKSHHKAVYDRVTKLNSPIVPDAKKVTSAAKKKAPNVDCDTHPTATDAKAYCDAKAAENAFTKEFDRKSKILAPIQNLVSGLFFLAILLVLLIPSLFGGATIGKRRQRIRVVRLDGSPAGPGNLFRRYGLLVFSAFALSFLLRSPVGALIVAFVASMWSRNPNMQGLQDRFAKTLVVTDAQG